MPKTPNTVALLRQLVAHDTVSHLSNLPLVEWLRGFFEDAGGTARLTFNDERTKANILASFGPSGDGGVILSGHTDVVPVDGQNWSSDPFTLREEDDRVYGRGAVDMKGFVAACLAAVAKARSTPLRKPLHVALSYDEEVGCIGVSRMIDDMVAHVGRAEVAIIGEPTNMGVGHSHRGISSCRTSFEGKAAHSSQPELGISAIYPAARFVGFIEDMNRSLKERNSATTLNVGRVDGGVAMNIVPAVCSVAWETRTPHPNDAQEVVQAVERYLHMLPDTVARRNEILCAAPALRNTDNERALALVGQFGAQLPARDLPFCTEAGFFQAASVQTIVCGPGSVNQAHKPDEWISRQQLTAADAFLDNVLAWCRK